MLQLPETDKPSQIELTQKRVVPAFHTRVPSFIKALPDDEGALILLVMSYSQAYDAFVNQSDVSWLAQRSEAAEEAVEKAHDSISDIINYLMTRLEKLPSISPKWQHHYLGVVARHCITGSLSVEDYIENILIASRQISVGEFKARAR